MPRTYPVGHRGGIANNRSNLQKRMLFDHRRFQWLPAFHATRIAKTAFQGRFAFGALITFLVTAADIPVFNIGAPFSGLVFGFATSWLLERGDFTAKD